MGGRDKSNIHGDGGSHNSILVDLNLVIQVYIKGFEGNLEAFRRVWAHNLIFKVISINFT